MKEYIAKEELIKRKRYINMANVSWNFIDDCPTVTKADICKEFAYKLTSRLVYDVQEGKAIINGIKLKDVINSIFKEMEEE